jgi:hypothetical protein
MLTCPRRLFNRSFQLPSLSQLIPPETLRSISLISNIILLLGRNNVPIHPSLVAELYDLVLESDVDPSKVLLDEETGEGLMMSLRAGRMS